MKTPGHQLKELGYLFLEMVRASKRGRLCDLEGSHWTVEKELKTDQGDQSEIVLQE